MARLSVNVDHVATVRQARLGREPDPVHAALLAEQAGAHGIIVHLREDRRHIQDRDLGLLRQMVKTHLNLEMAAVEEIIAIALQVRPDMVTLVPERREELTTEGGLDVVAHLDQIRDAVARMRQASIRVSLFVDPDENSIEASARAGAQVVEIHTGRYADAQSGLQREEEFMRIRRAAVLARQLGLEVHAGHGLDYRNVSPLVSIGEIEEFSIGHSIVARAVLVGMERAVAEMLALVRG
ncbi:MAG: pyridoxine 5'-phosphate synthase [Thermodesulfobacteriota bacterium]